MIVEDLDESYQLEKIDLSELLGLSLEEAEKKAASFGWRSRPISIDGKALIVTADLCQTRVNFSVLGNKIVNVSVG